MDIDFGIGFADVMQSAGTFQIGIHHHHPVFAVGHVFQNFADIFAEIIPVLGLFGSASTICGRFCFGEGCFQNLDSGCLAVTLEISNGEIDRDHIVSLGRTFDAFYLRSHFAVVDKGDRAGGCQSFLNSFKKRVDVFPASGIDGEAMAHQRFFDVITFHVLAGMTGDGDIVVVDEELDVQLLRDGISGGFGIGAFLLRAVTAEQNHHSVRMSGRYPVDMTPQMPEPAGTEKDSGCIVPFGMSV